MVLSVLLLLAGTQSGELAKARELYLKAVAGDRDAARASESILNGLIREQPADARALAYSGSLHVLESGRTMALWKRGSLAKKGLDKLDRAVALSPGDAEVRVVRAVSTFHLPGFFRREQQCRDDFSFVTGRVRELSPEMAAAAHYHYGLLLDKHGNRQAAAAAWRQAVQSAPQSRSGRQAAQLLLR